MSYANPQFTSDSGAVGGAGSGDYADISHDAYPYPEKDKLPYDVYVPPEYIPNPHPADPPPAYTGPSNDLDELPIKEDLKSQLCDVDLQWFVGKLKMDEHCEPQVVLAGLNIFLMLVHLIMYAKQNWWTRGANPMDVKEFNFCVLWWSGLLLKEEECSSYKLSIKDGMSSFSKLLSVYNAFETYLCLVIVAQSSLKV